MKKYINRPLFITAIILSILGGLEMPFNTATYSYIFYLIEKHALNLVLPSVIIVGLIYGILGVIEYTNSYVINQNIVKINTKLKNNYVIRKMSTVNENDKDFEAGSLSFFMNDLKLLETNYWRQFFSLLGSIVTTVGTLLFALYNSFYLTLVFMVFMIIPTFAPKLFSKQIQAKTNHWSDRNKTLSSTVRDLFHGALLLKRYGAIKGFWPRLNRSVTSMEQANAQMNNEIALSNTVINVLFFIFSYIPMGIGIYFTISGHLQLSQFVAVQYSSSWVLNGFNGMMRSWNTMNSTKKVQKRLLSLDNDDDEDNPKASSDESFADLKLTNVSFAYNEQAIFSNLNLAIEQHNKVLISGESGVGKSTLIKLILKELTPNNGQLLLNGHDYSQGDAYACLGIVSQTPVIFEDTIKNNITLGKKAPDDETIFAALQAAGLADFANPAGLNKVISEDGHNLSGGQLKRIEIARALFFNRHVLLIDEGTASLDVKTSESIHQAILSHPDLTVIEVDHHIPDAILKMYDAKYELRKNGLFKLN